jgi:hypothetical protein
MTALNTISFLIFGFVFLLFYFDLLRGIAQSRLIEMNCPSLFQIVLNLSNERREVLRVGSEVICTSAEPKDKLIKKRNG